MSVNLSNEFSQQFSKSKFRPKSVEFDAKDRVIFGLCSVEEMDSCFNTYSAQSPFKSIPLQKLFHLKEQPNRSSGGIGFSPKSIPRIAPPLNDVEAEYSATRMSDNASPDPMEEDTRFLRGRQRSLTKKKSANYVVNWQQLDEETLKLMAEFGISQAIWSAISSEEEREKYIIECMKRKLEEDVERWRKEVEQQERNVQKFERTAQEKEQRLQREKADIFKWLKVKTDFPYLKEKLKADLMELMNDYDNQRDLEKSVGDLRKSQDSFNHSKRITIEHHVPSVRTTEILADVLGHSEALFKVTKRQRKKSQNTTNADLAGVPRGSVVSSHGSSIPHQSSNMSASATGGDVGSRRDSVHFKSTDVGSSTTEKGRDSGLSTPYVWSGDAEQVFKEHKEEARARMFNEIKSSSWNEVAMSPFIQASNMEEKSRGQRKIKLSLYGEGQALTSEDYNYLANSSMLLNNCSDKQFVQTIVNNLEPEIIDAVEIDIAQNVLHNYQQTRAVIKNARIDYLHKVNQRNRQIVAENDEILAQMHRVREGTSEQKKMKKQMEVKIELYERRKFLERKSQEMNMSLDEKKMKDIVRKMMQPIKDKVQERKLHGQHFYKKKEPIIDAKFSKRYHHPSSKILLNPEARVHEFMGLSAGMIEPKLLKRQNENATEYKLGIHSPLPLRNPTFFKKYYTGGPSQLHGDFGSAYYANDIPKFKGTELEHKAATHLKAVITGFIQRDLFRNKTRKQLENLKAMRKNIKKTPGRLSRLFMSEYINIKDVQERSSQNNLLSTSNRRVRRASLLGKKDLNSSITSLDLQDTDNRKKHDRSRAINSRLSLMDDPREGDATPLRVHSKLSIMNALKPVAKAIIDNNVSKGEFSESILKLDSDGRPKDGLRKRAYSGAKEVRIDTTTSIDDHTERNFVIRPTTAVHRRQGSLGGRPQTAKNSNGAMFSPFSNLDPKAKIGIVGPNYNMKKLNTNLMNNTKGSQSKQNESTQREAIKAQVEEELQKRLGKIASRAPPKGLLLKQRKLLTAAKSNNLPLVRSTGFTYFEPDVNAKDEKGNTPLYYTAKFGNLEFCQFLLDHGARVNDSCEQGNTPLHMAFASDKEGVAILLLIQGGNLNTLNKEGLTPLAYGSERMLTMLDLKSGIATYAVNEDDEIKMLPEEMDNNYLLARGNWKKPKEDDTAVFKYKPLESPREAIRHEEKHIATYMQAGVDSLDRYNKMLKPANAEPIAQELSIDTQVSKDY